MRRRRSASKGRCSLTGEVDIDLHLHTNRSDGEEDPSALVARAHASGLRTIAVTDHDGTDGVEEAIEAGMRLGMRVIPGVELSTRWTDAAHESGEVEYTMHLLGYGIDIHHDALAGRIGYVLAKRAERNERLRRALQDLGVSVPEAVLARHAAGEFVGRRTFAAALVELGYVKSADEAFASAELLGHPEIRSIKKEKICAEEAIALLHDAGGKVFLAHPFQTGFSPKERHPDGVLQALLAIIPRFAEMGLDGIEAYYPTHDEEGTNFLLQLADDYGLLVSIGSDDHGPCAREVKRIGSFQAQIDTGRLAWVEALAAATG